MPRFKFSHCKYGVGEWVRYEGHSYKITNIQLHLGQYWITLRGIPGLVVEDEIKGLMDDK